MLRAVRRECAREHRLRSRDELATGREGAACALPPGGRACFAQPYGTTRLAASVASGRRLAPWSLDWIVGAMLATHAEFGALDERAATATPGVAIDERTRRAMQLRRMRELVALARQTEYYAREPATPGAGGACT